MKKLLACIGFQKCGTTTVFDGLVMSQSFNRTEDKEPYLFSHNYDAFKAGGIEQFFPGADDSKYYLDFTPTYHQQPVLTLDRMSRHFQDINVAFCLRNPISRAFSQYNHAFQANVLKPLTEKRHFGPNPKRGGIRPSVLERVRENAQQTFVASAAALPEFPTYLNVITNIEKTGIADLRYLVLEEDMTPRGVANIFGKFLQNQDDIGRVKFGWSNPARPFAMFLEESRDFTFTFQGQSIACKKGDLVIIRADRAEVVERLDMDFKRDLYEVYLSRVMRVDASTVLAMSRLIEDRILALETKIGRSLDCWRLHKALSRREAEFTVSTA